MTAKIKQHYKWLLFGAMVLVQIILFISPIVTNARILANGVEFWVRNSAASGGARINGRYIQTRPEVNVTYRARPRDSIYGGHYIRLQTGGDGFAEVVEISQHWLNGDGVIWLENIHWGNWRDRSSIILPIYRYYLGASFDLPRLPGGLDVYATIRVHNGNARIRGLYVHDMRLEDFLE